MSWVPRSTGYVPGRSGGRIHKASARLLTLGIQRFRRWIKPSFGTVRYIRVVEWQRRGLIHVHAIVITTADEFMIRRAFQGGPGIRGSFRRHAPFSTMVSRGVRGWTSRRSKERPGRRAFAGIWPNCRIRVEGRSDRNVRSSPDPRGHAADRRAHPMQVRPPRLGADGPIPARQGERMEIQRNRSPLPQSISGVQDGWIHRLCVRQGPRFGTETRSDLKDVRRQHVRTSIAMDIADQRGDEAAQRYLDECDAPSVEIVAARTSSSRASTQQSSTKCGVWRSWRIRISPNSARRPTSSPASSCATPNGTFPNPSCHALSVAIRPWTRRAPL